MKRRAFAQATVAGLCAAATGIGTRAMGEERRVEPAAAGTEIYELRTYTLKAAKLPLLDAYLKEALIPAAHRLGLGPVGVFSEIESTEREVVSKKNTDTAAPAGMQRVTVLLIHKSADSALALPAALAADTVYLKAADEYLGVKADDPAYRRIGTVLVKAIAGMPKIEKPDPTKARLFNLRVYESHNERAAAKKVEMFEKGEIEIFRQNGLTPVFFASALSGPNLPNLTYFLVFPDDDNRKASWGKFVKDPAWKKLSSMPEYADKEIVSTITNKLLTPRAYSEI